MFFNISLASTSQQYYLSPNLALISFQSAPSVLKREFNDYY